MYEEEAIKFIKEAMKCGKFNERLTELQYKNFFFIPLERHVCVFSSLNNFLYIEHEKLADKLIKMLELARKI